MAPRKKKQSKVQKQLKSKVQPVHTRNKKKPVRQRVTCNVCEKKFSAAYLKFHMKRAHATEQAESFCCEWCQASFKDKNRLVKHLGNHEGRDKPFSCSICDRKFSHESYLKVHKRVHSGEKPYSCDQCSRKFLIKSALTIHQRQHNGERPFSCPLCDRRFTDQGILRKHLRTHTGERPYSCEICQKSFAVTATLTKHLRTHSGERPFACVLCERRFAQKYNLMAHLDVHILEKPKPTTPYALGFPPFKFEKIK